MIPWEGGGDPGWQPWIICTGDTDLRGLGFPKSRVMGIHWENGKEKGTYDLRFRD